MIYISSELANCLSKNQGSENVGKILIVGADGNLVLSDIPEAIIGGDVVGILDEDNNIIVTGELSDGTYVFKYENTDGTYADIGSLVIGGVVQYSITATLTECTAASGNAEIIEDGGTATLTFVANDGYALTDTVSVSGASYTWDSTTGTLVLSNPTADVTVAITATKSRYTNLLDTIGYYDGYRISASSGTNSACENRVATGYIPITGGDVVRVKGMTFPTSSVGTYVLGYYHTDETFIAGNTIYQGMGDWNHFSFEFDGDLLTITRYEDYSEVLIRVSGEATTGADCIVTLNEEIIE